MFVKSLSRARGFLDRGNAPWHSMCTPSTLGAEWNLEAYAVYEIAETHRQTLSEVDVGLWMGWRSWSAATLGTLLRFATLLSPSISLGVSFALATRSLSLERNECANVLQVGFIKSEELAHRYSLLTIPMFQAATSSAALTWTPHSGHIAHRKLRK